MIQQAGEIKLVQRWHYAPFPLSIWKLGKDNIYGYSVHVKMVPVLEGQKNTLNFWHKAENSPNQNLTMPTVPSFML